MKKQSIVLMLALILLGSITLSVTAASQQPKSYALAGQVAAQTIRPGPGAAVLAVDTDIGPTEVITAPGAMALAEAMDIPTADLVSASIGTTDPRGTGIADEPISFFPTQGQTFSILSTGLAESADDPDTNNDEVYQGGGTLDDISFRLDGLNNSQGNDLVQLTLVLTPPPGMTSLSFDFAFYSEEFPDYIGFDFNDAFIAELGAEPFDSMITIVGNEINSPANFALDPNGEVVSVNVAFGFNPADPNPDTDTTYDGTSGLLSAIGCLPEEPPTGNVVLILSITDLGDSILDSAVFLDNFQWGTSPACGVLQPRIQLMPKEAENPIHTTHTVTATVTNTQGDPVPDQTVGFSVSGANSASSSATTDANGQATFTYTGANMGDDIITAWVDQDSDGVQDSDEPFDLATKIWEKPTAITLVSFTATGQDGQVLLKWQTASEIDNEGFNLWRSTTLRGDFVQINPALIPAQGNETMGHTYTYLDSNVTNGVTYYYKLEDIDMFAGSTFHGPMSATPSKIHQTYLPLILK